MLLLALLAVFTAVLAIAFAKGTAGSGRYFGKADGFLNRADVAFAQRRYDRARRRAGPGEAYFSSSTCFAGFRYWSLSLSSDQSRPRVTIVRYRASATVALLWPSVVPNTRVLSL